MITQLMAALVGIVVLITPSQNRYLFGACVRADSVRIEDNIRSQLPFGRALGDLGGDMRFPDSSLRLANQPVGQKCIDRNNGQPEEIEPKHGWIIGPTAFAAGLIVLGLGWRELFNCVGFWPDDRRNIVLGLPLVALGIGLLLWGLNQVLFAQHAVHYISAAIAS